MQFISTFIMSVTRRPLWSITSLFLGVILIPLYSVPLFAGDFVHQSANMVFKRDPTAVNAGFSHEGNNCAVDSNDDAHDSSGVALVIAPDAYSYSVVGSGCGHSVYGVLNADGNGGVSGYLFLENGEQTSFYGDWVGDGVAEGFDNNGNLFTVRVDD